MPAQYLLLTSLLYAVSSQKFEAYVKTGDGKFLCHGDVPYTKFPEIPDDTTSVECQSQFFREFREETFSNKRYLSAIDVSNGNIKTLEKNTFIGTVSLRRFNASRCKLQGEIPEDTFCENTPNLRSVDLSYNTDYVFDHAPFKCLDNLVELRISGTKQNCNPETNKWIKDKRVTIVGYACISPTASPLPAQECTHGALIGTSVFLTFVLLLLIVASTLFLAERKKNKNLHEECDQLQGRVSDLLSHREQQGIMDGDIRHNDDAAAPLAGNDAGNR